ncbi:hypothetical protein C8F04DRAFT_134137 [Mycena alexandri]|uniref:Uncharacterized protein n=1 Tax=Mycena alexandri TaxID=1745969 RepID=A0AAD6SCX4_9AGAR|nr:hypothetical protein C8F04DRAFT_134137 [Mycena alexandri]
MDIHPRLPPFVTRETLDTDLVSSGKLREKAKANHLLRQLQTRLQYARLKVDHGWQKQRLNEVENLYFRAQRHPQAAGSLKPPSTAQEYTPLLSTPLDPQLLAQDETTSSLSFKLPSDATGMEGSQLSGSESMALAQYTHAYTNSASGSGSGWQVEASTSTSYTHHPSHPPAADPLSQWIQLPPSSTAPPPPAASLGPPPAAPQNPHSASSYDAFWTSHSGASGPSAESTAAQIQLFLTTSAATGGPPPFLNTPTFASSSGSGAPDPTYVSGHSQITPRAGGAKGKGRVNGGAVVKQRSPRRSPVRVVGASG